jgi:uncharacterized protein
MSVDTVAPARHTPVTLPGRDGVRLFAMLSMPAEPTGRPAIVLLPAGIKMRVGPQRIYKRMAERFVALGHPVLRLDTHGLGDSEGEITERAMPDLFGTIQLGRYVGDTRAAMDWLETTHGITRFIGAGLCGGAITALLAADEDPRVVGVLGLGMPVILDGGGVEYWRYMTTHQLKGTRGRYLSKLKIWEPRVWKSWWRFVTLQSHYSLIGQSVLMRKHTAPAAAVPEAPGVEVKAPAAQAQAPPKAPAQAEPPAPTDNTNPRFAPAFLRLLAASRPILLVFGGADRLRWEFDEKFATRHRAAIDAQPGRYELVVTPDANHIFSLGEWQRHMLEHAATWLGRFA